MKPADDSYNHILAEAGVGFKYFLSDNMAIRADIRDVQEKYNRSGLSAQTSPVDHANSKVVVRPKFTLMREGSLTIRYSVLFMGYC